MKGTQPHALVVACCALLLCCCPDRAAAQTILQSPFETGNCPTGNATYYVNGFPGTPFQLQNLFTQPFKNPPVLDPKFGSPTCRSNGDGHCITSYEIEVKDIQAQPFNTIIPACANLPGTHFMAYNGVIPGPTIIATAGQETIVRFKNNIGGEKFGATKAPCGTNGKPGGRPFSVHLHGSASLAPFDGWAEDLTCQGQTKEYVYPNNRPVTGWYHDHALHITADNAYFGMAGMYLMSAKKQHGGCGEPWNLEDIEELHMILADKVLDSQCQHYIDHAGAHQDDFYGDITLVSGIPFPLFELDAKSYRLRLLNAAVTRPYLIKIVDEARREVSSSMCHIIASDGGYRSTPVRFPATGLFMGAAERYEAVCDFSKYAGQTLYLYNDRDDDVMRDTPYFCYSHLIGKIQVAATGSGADLEPADNSIAPNQPLYKVMSPAEMQEAVAMANAEQAHRTMEFGRSNGHWTINGETWETFKIAAADVGQNTWEVWRFETGGGWYHPIHVHLVDIFMLSRDRDGGLKPYEKDSPKDVFFLGPSQTIYVVARFGAHRGDFMFHCHNLMHEDNDMMRALRVTSGGKNAASASAFVQIDDIIYSNWAYYDPMLEEAQAKTDIPELTQDYEAGILSKNMYKIFYPDETEADSELLMSTSNPWRSNWEGRCSIPTAAPETIVPTVPEVTEPTVTEPIVPTEPITTAPETTEPITTTPEITEPVATEPTQPTPEPIVEPTTPTTEATVDPPSVVDCSMALYDGKQFTGKKAFRKVKGIALEECSGRCLENPKCLSFTYRNSKKECQMYSLPAEKMNLRKKKGYNSGTESCFPQQTRRRLARKLA